MTAKTTTASMFESIKGALANASKNTGYRDILKLEADKTYKVRLLPNTKNPEDTFYHYFHHGWPSAVTGQYISAISPSTFEERCPISEEYFKLYREAGKDEAKLKIAQLLKRKESWYTNVYVIEDPVTPDNVGKVKILRFGKQIMKIIEAAISGEDASEYGARIFDLGPDGCDFRIKPEKKSQKGRTDFAIEYTASRFLNPSAIPGMTDEKAAEVLTQLHDLTAIDERKNEAELEKMLAVHFYGEQPESSETEKAPAKDVSAVTKAAGAAAAKAARTTKAETKAEDDIPYEHPTDKAAAEKIAEKVADAAAGKSVTVSTEDPDAIDALLDGLGK